MQACVLILLYLRPHTTVHVSSYYYMFCDTAEGVCEQSLSSFFASAAGSCNQHASDRWRLLFCR